MCLCLSLPRKASRLIDKPWPKTRPALFQRKISRATHPHAKILPSSVRLSRSKWSSRPLWKQAARTLRIPFSLAPIARLPRPWPSAPMLARLEEIVDKRARRQDCDCRFFRHQPWFQQYFGNIKVARCRSNDERTIQVF